jgi:Thermophilic metalloprotease (M29)
VRRVCAGPVEQPRHDHRARPDAPDSLRREDRGTVHLALGRSYPETGGKNESALHWDLICDLRRGGRLLADGDVIQDGGRFV